MYLLLCGDWPFNSSNGNEKAIFKKVLKGKFSFSGSIWSQISQEAKNLIKMLLNYEPAHRIDARAAINHPWFQEMNVAERAKNKEYMNVKTINRLKNFKMNKTKMQQEVIQIMVNFLKDEEIEGQKKAFRYTDTEGAGFIETPQLIKVMRELGFKDTEEEVREIISNTSRTDEKHITYIEFIAATLERSIFMDKDNLRGAFRYFDVNERGIIAPEDMKECFARFGKSFENHEIVELIQEVEGKSDNRISWEDFLELMHISNLETQSHIIITNPNEDDSKEF